jgi:hypothetical protein
MVTLNLEKSLVVLDCLCTENFLLYIIKSFSYENIVVTIKHISICFIEDIGSSTAMIMNYPTRRRKS